MQFRDILNAVASVVAETPEGAPSGVIYAGCSCNGIDLERYQQVVSILTNEALIERRGDLLLPTTKLLRAYAAAKEDATAEKNTRKNANLDAGGANAL